jgi:regulator of protease activity HflC (stomatin/prohibitin superfamily)
MFTSTNIILAFLGLSLFIYILSGLNIVNEWERAPVIRFGKYLRTLGAGVRWIEPFTNRVQAKVSIQDEVRQLAMPNIQTHDNVPVAFTLLLTTRIDMTAGRDGVKDNFLNIENPEPAILQKAIAVVSETVSGTELDKILHERTALYTKIVTALQDRIAHWGYVILAVEIKDIQITDVSISDAISLKARAGKEGEAELVKAQFQLQIAQALKLAADVYDDNARWLKQQETLLELGRSAENNTIIIPVDFGGRIAVGTGKI